MSFDQYELPPLDKRPKPDFHVWLKIRQYFKEQQAELVRIREKEGKTAANIAHEEMVAGIDAEDIDAWERLFAEGKWQYPHAQEMVEEARTALARFLGDILTPQEEALRELRKIEDELMKHLLYQKLEVGDPEPLNLKAIFNKVERYGALSGSSEEMSTLINQIMSLISQAAVMMNK